MLYRFISGDFPIAFIILLTLAGWAVGHRSTVRELLFDPAPRWRWTGRITVALVVLLPLWTAAADNYRQLLGHGVNIRVRWMTDAFETAPTPGWARLVTHAILALSLLGAAALYAQRQNGLTMLVIILALSTVYFYFFNALRMRGDVFLRTTEGKLDGLDPIDLGFTLFWAGCFLAFVASVVAAAYCWLFALTAIPLHALYTVLSRRRQPAAPEPGSIYDLLRPGRTVDPPRSAPGPTADTPRPDRPA